MYLELTDISKKIGADEVLSGITLSMEKGKVYGLQGKNGCGKSMLMRVICGLVLPTVGEVKIDGKILGKPADTEEAREMIYKLQGKSHMVYTGVTVIAKSGDMVSASSFAEGTKVNVAPMTENEIEAYISTDEPYDKAGAYGIQGPFAIHIEKINGDYNNVVGLPISRLYHEINNFSDLC